MNILLVSGMSGICHINVVDAKFAVSFFVHDECRGAYIRHPTKTSFEDPRSICA